MRVIIIEDEKLSAEHLQNTLQKLNENILIVTTIDSVKQSIALLKNGLQADLLFVDIHLADGISFDIFEAIQIEIPIIFTTAYNEYAIKAFQLNSIDYLLKPIDKADLQRALDKFEKYKLQYQPITSSVLANAYIDATKQYKNRFIVKSGQTIDSIKTEDVHHFTTIDSITFLVATNGKKYPIDYTLDQLGTIISSFDFFRINRKTIIHFNAIEKVNTFFNSRLAITAAHIDGEASIVSRERVNDFKQWLDK
jgi:DNA-binding LytR/AlgR family response regulator